MIAKEIPNLVGIQSQATYLIYPKPQICISKLVKYDYNQRLRPNHVFNFFQKIHYNYGEYPQGFYQKFVLILFITLKSKLGIILNIYL